jgi:diguanylate cyclase (GGDEF)-like protein
MIAAEVVSGHRLAAITTKDRVLAFLMRHRVKITDLTFAASALLVVAYLLFEIDVFLIDQSGPSDKTLELDELALFGAALSVALLIFSWRRFRELKQETERRHVAERRARELAFQDALTGLPNRRQFNEALGIAVASPPRSGGVHAMLMLDLNGFKQINDVYGHGAGDEVLIVVGERLLASVRQGDLVARLGGDEFTILAQHLTSAESATGIARRIASELSEPITIGGVMHKVDTGIGICLFPFDGDSSAEVMRRADVALYKAKGERQTSARFFDSEMDRYVREREFMERELRGAVAREEVTPHFQPLVDLKTRQIIGFEALARWTHPALGVIPPERFIPIAEDCGLIRELSDQLLRRACRAAREWPAHVWLSFNISPAQLRDRGLGLRIIAILGETGLSPHRLELEITESALVREITAAQEVLGALREAGVRIALDDFGTGYSNLYHLRKFKIDKIKIDRTFIDSMAAERESAEIVNALVGLGHGLGFTVTAEGIESFDQENALLDKGCEQGQGFLFGRAVPENEAKALVCEPGPKRAASRRV